MNHSGHPNRQKRPGSCLPRACCPRRIHPHLAVIALFLIFTFFTPVVLALAAGTNLLEDDPAQPWNIAADKITRDQKTGNLVAFGNVIITKQGKRLTADRIVFNQKTGDIRAEGHVMLTTGKDVLTGSRVEWNLNTRKDESSKIQIVLAVLMTSNLAFSRRFGRAVFCPISTVILAMAPLHYLHHLCLPRV